MRHSNIIGVFVGVGSFLVLESFEECCLQSAQRCRKHRIFQYPRSVILFVAVTAAALLRVLRYEHFNIAIYRRYAYFIDIVVTCSYHCSLDSSEQCSDRFETENSFVYRTRLLHRHGISRRVILSEESQMEIK